MKIVAAPNAFKGSLSAVAAAEAMAAGVADVLADAVVVRVPLADGGDGTMETLVAATGGSVREVRVSDPLGRPIRSAYGILGDGRTAVIEMAAASGLRLLRPDEYNPMITTTRGTGELIRAALDEGAEAVFLGIGGSATTDGGIGMAEALGARFLDERGGPVGHGGNALERVRSIDTTAIDPRIRRVPISCACDVANPLTGSDGAAAVYSPQKGATPEMVKRLEAGLANLAAVIRRDLGLNVATVPGAGAAGGLGAAIPAFLGGQLLPGVDLVIRHSGLEEALADADLVLTGEGRVDRSTQFGKVPVGVATRAKDRHIPVICFAGAVSPDAASLHDHGIDAIIAICPEPMDAGTALAAAAVNLARAVRETMHVWRSAGSR